MISRCGPLRLVAMLLMLGFVGAGPALADPGNAAPSDFFVSDPSTLSGAGGIIRSDQFVGPNLSWNVIATGPPLVDPAGIAIDRSGDLLVADPTFGGVVRVDRSSGAQAVVTSGGSLIDPAGVAREGNGDILVADPVDFFAGGDGRIVRIDRNTGAQSILSSGGALEDPIGIALEQNGQILVADGNLNGSGKLVRVDPRTGAQTTVASNLPGGITGVAVTQAGRVFVVGSNTGAVVQVDPETGAQTTVASGLNLVNPTDVAVIASGNHEQGNLLVTNANGSGPGIVVRINPQTGAQNTSYAGGDFVDPQGITGGHGPNELISPTPVPRG